MKNDGAPGVPTAGSKRHNRTRGDCRAPHFSASDVYVLVHVLLRLPPTLDRGLDQAIIMKIQNILVSSRVVLLLSCGLEMALADQIEKQTVVYKQVGPLGIRADIYYYNDTKMRPVVVSLHGGALIMGHRENLSNPVKSFAHTNGYVLASFDYRLAPETKLPAILEDIEDAFRWLRREGAKQFHMDPDRVAVTGGSAGGYLTLATGHRVQPRPRVLLAFFGYGDLIGDWYATPSPHSRHNQRKITAEEAWQQVSGPAVADARDRKGDGGIFYNFCRQTGNWPKAVAGWDPRSESEKFFPFMPVKNVTAQYPPTVLIHGTADTDVPFAQSQMMAEEFRKHGVAFQFHQIDKAEHGLSGGNRSEIEEAQRKAFEFVKLYLERP
jgi:acetyl esterase/lipase